MNPGQIKTVLIDGYLDEPSCLGVPPYVSPHIRYIYGSLIDGGIKRTNIEYLTADDYRREKEQNLASLAAKDLVVIMAGTTVPGNYLEGRPLSLTEIKEISEKITYPTLVLTGPITLVWKNLPNSKEISKNLDIITSEVGAVELYLRLCQQGKKKREIAADRLRAAYKFKAKQSDLSLEKLKNQSNVIASALSKWALTGAEIFSRHPKFPKLIAEIETCRGCPRIKGCKFCSEQLKNIKYQRKPESIIKEVRAIAEKNIHNFRLGCQTDLLSYTGELELQNTEMNGQNSLLNKNSTALEYLYKGIRAVDPELKVLHLDNINPGLLGRNKKLGEKSIEIISRYNTPGDVAAFGLESADPEVLKANNIDTSPQETFEAIKLINKIGARREKGIPKLLPGLNFLVGLQGENSATYKLNLKYLEKIKNAGLLLRRINIRQVNTLGSYPGLEVKRSSLKELKKEVNEKINRPMLRKVFPQGTILDNIWPSKIKGGLTYGRPPGTYPILIGIPGQHLDKEIMEVQVIDHGYRSITGLPHPFAINKANIKELTYIPGIGESRARRIVLEKPQNQQELKEVLGPSFPWENLEPLNLDFSN